MFGSDLIFNRFVLEVLKAQAKFLEVLKGVDEFTSLRFEYKPLTSVLFKFKQQKIEQDVLNDFDRVNYTVYLKNKCLYLQVIIFILKHEKLFMNFPVQSLGIQESNLLQKATQVQFKYMTFENGKRKILDFTYDLWVNPCYEPGALKFDVVVKQKIDVTLFFIEFYYRANFYGF